MANIRAKGNMYRYFRASSGPWDQRTQRMRARIHFPLYTNITFVVTRLAVCYICTDIDVIPAIAFPWSSLIPTMRHMGTVIGLRQSRFKALKPAFKAQCKKTAKGLMFGLCRVSM